jgi:AAA15 family ATPase/GTPase
LNNKRKNSSQLIVTTHESSLLDLKLLRRDEIWFVEKDGDGASSVYSLEEFTPRYDKDVRKGYLLGRFGAVPVVRNGSERAWAS